MITIAPGKHYQCSNKYNIHLVHLFFLIHSHIVNYHLAWEDSIINTLGTTPVPAHSYIKQQVEPLVKGPYLVTRALILKSEIKIIININTIPVSYTHLRAHETDS